MIDDRVAFVGGIDLTLDGGDPYDTPNHRARGGIGWHDAAVRIEGPAVRGRRRALPAALARARRGRAARRLRPAGACRRRRAPDRAHAARGHVPRGAARATTRSSSRTSARCARPSGSSTSRTSSSGRPRSSTCSSTSSRDPPSDDFRVVVLLPARANDGADISRGQVAALIDADDGDERFLACTVYAREGKLRDIVYVHAKIGIVDDRWLTVGSANLNAHSLLNDTEMNVVTHDERSRAATRLRLWAEHLERDEEEVAGDPAALVDELWRPIADRAAPPDREAASR